MGIRTNKQKLIGLVCLIFFTCLMPLVTTAQVEIPKNEKARQLFKLGKNYLEKGKHLDAAQSFEIALAQPFNQLTTTNLYYAGLCWYHLGKEFKAKKYLNQIIYDYPKSLYLEDAKYHKTMLLLSSDDNSIRELGLTLMLELYQKCPNEQIRDLALASIKEHIFNIYDRKFLDVYYLFCDPRYKGIILEGICYHLSIINEGYLINDKIDSFIEQGGKLTPYLVSMKRTFGDGDGENPEELNIAVFLPFYISIADTSEEIPSKTIRPLELFKGMKLALDSLSSGFSRKVTVRVFDTEKDTAIIRTQLEELESFHPTLILGDISTKSCKPIGDWAEKNGIPQFVPLNPSDNLIKGRDNVFLTHPSIKTHGRGMAEYMVNELAMHRIVIFYDSSPISNAIAKEFMSTVDSLGGLISVKRIPQFFDKENTPIKTQVEKLEGVEFDAVFVPISSEENANMILTRLNFEKIETQVFGSPDWESFSAIDMELKSKYNLTYSTFYFERNDSAGADQFREDYISVYQDYPTRYAVQGYDIMQFILSVCRFSNPFQPLSDQFRDAQKYHGIHQDFIYSGQQDNQKVTIVRVDEGRILKANEPGTE